MKVSWVQAGDPRVQALDGLPDEEFETVIHDALALRFQRYAKQPSNMTRLVSFVRGLIQAGDHRKVATRGSR